MSGAPAPPGDPRSAGIPRAGDDPQSAPPTPAGPPLTPAGSPPMPAGPSPTAAGSPPTPAGSPPAAVRVTVRLNGASHSAEVEPRTLLSDFIRDQGLTGTKVGCEHGVCGACTVQLDGEPVRSCLLLAVQAEGCDVRTVEGLASGSLQRSFHEHHALQCGFCTAGILMTLDAYLAQHPDPTEQQLREALAGTLCRCTGYKPIVEAVLNR